MLDQPRLSNATAISDVTALAMDRVSIEASIGGKLTSVMHHEMRKRALKALPIFANSNVTDSELDRLVGCMQDESCSKGHQLAEVGKQCDPNLCLIREGRVIVYDDENGNLYNLESGDYFGDKFIKSDEDIPVSTETATCEEDVTVDVLTRDDIEEVIGNLERLGKAAKLFRSKQTKTILLRNLQKHRILGRGGFGKVWLVSHPKEDDPDGERDVYALKVIDKVRIIDSKLTKAVVHEKELLCLLDHPFILNLVHSYQDEENLYLLMPFIPGGELYGVLQRARSHDRGMQPVSAAFYASGIIEALAHFHQRWIAYRDLKLENVAIDRDGYGVIVDLGFAKVVTGKTYTLVGTPEMLAPEIILSKGHDEAVDFWAFGIVCYELLVGKNPFHDHGAKQMYIFKRIVRLDFDFPEYVDDAAKNLIQGLLVRQPSKRLGNLSKGYLDIKRHDWFQENGVKFKQIRRKEVPAPWVPDTRDPISFNLLQQMMSMDFDEAPSRHLSRTEQEIFKDF
jgi:serine/threonine protein kinase/CRP-like cAMP-binding protein